MHKTKRLFTLSLVLLVAIACSAPAFAADDVSIKEPTEMANVQLTDKQKKELASQYKDILKREHKVIATYVKYGVLTKEQGDMISSHLDKRYMKLEQNGFVPQWGKHHGKHHMKDHKHHEHHGHHHHDKQREAE